MSSGSRSSSKDSAPPVDPADAKGVHWGSQWKGEVVDLSKTNSSSDESQGMVGFFKNGSSPAVYFGIIATDPAVDGYMVLMTKVLSSGAVLMHSTEINDLYSKIGIDQAVIFYKDSKGSKKVNLPISSSSYIKMSSSKSSLTVTFLVKLKTGRTIKGRFEGELTPMARLFSPDNNN